jgi:transcriptional regulator with XRE-family HTH domain
MNIERPDVVERQAKNKKKSDIAMKLRTLRDARGMTQSDVASASGMSQPVIARLEALTGSIPSLVSIERYVDACKGFINVIISTEEIVSVEQEVA